MKRLLLLGLYASNAAALQAPQFFKWSHTIDVPSDIVITIESVSATRLQSLLLKHGSRERAQAFSIIHGRADAHWSCEIFIGPTNDWSGALAHETKHCNGWTHE